MPSASITTKYLYLLKRKKRNGLTGNNFKSVTGIDHGQGQGVQFIMGLKINRQKKDRVTAVFKCFFKEVKIVIICLLPPVEASHGGRSRPRHRRLGR